VQDGLENRRGKPNSCAAKPTT